MIELRNCQNVEFRCRLTSPLHITQRSYANLLKCAPFIPGSALRGALVGYLIQRDCPPGKIEQLQRRQVEDVRRFHLECEECCLVRDFFEPGRVIFSFGLFPELDIGRYRSVTRVALTRDGRTVSQGRLVGVEQVAPPAPFTFTISLFNGARAWSLLLEQVVSEVGEYVGVGRFKSIGMGRFQVLEKGIHYTVLSEVVEDRLLKLEQALNRGRGAIPLSLRTPLVIEWGKPLYSTDDRKLAGDLSRLFHQRAVESVEPTELLSPPKLERTSIRVKPEFITRYSLETDQREGRLALWPGSEFILYGSPFDEATLFQIAVGSVLGIGEWCDWGFGRFAVRD